MSAEPLGRPLPERPMLLPGLRVTRRTDRYLQVGLDAGVAVAFADSDDVREALAAVERGARCPSTPSAARVYRRLQDEGLLVDARALRAALRDRPDGDTQATAAVFAHADLDAPTVLDRRRSAVVLVDGPERAARTALEILEHAGIAATTPDAVSTIEPTAVLIVACPEFHRPTVDRWTQRGVPHLLTQCVDGAWWVGPFVAPGENACLRCVDAHRRDREPGRGLVVAQYADRLRPRSGGVPEPVDPAMATVAMGWATRDLMSFVDGERPSTWSASVRIGPAVWLEHHRWSRHPDCGCAWDLLDR